MVFKGTRLEGQKQGVVQEIIDVAQLPERNRWLPASILAYHFDISPQTIRNLFDTGQIQCFRFPKGPMLFSAEEVELRRHTKRRHKS